MKKWFDELVSTGEKLGDNLKSVLIYVLVMALIYGVAYVIEKKMGLRKKYDVKRLTIIAVFSALAFVLMFFEINIPIVPEFYKIDLSEVPIMIGSFILGPTAGIVMECAKIFLKVLFKGTSTMFVGDFANVLIGCMFVVPASCIYHAKKTRKTALIGMAIGTVLMAVVGSALNAYLLIPTYAKLFHLNSEVIVGMASKVNGLVKDFNTFIFFGVFPFNIIKGIAVTLITMLLYKKIRKLFA